MKSLQESLFDKDNIKSNVELGELYELAPGNYSNYFSNDGAAFLRIFDKNKLLKIYNSHRYVNTDHTLFKYTYGVDEKISMGLIELLLRCPIHILDQENFSKVQRDLKEYLKPYVLKDKYNRLSVGVNRYKYKENKEILWTYNITLIDGIMETRPNSLNVMFGKK